MNKVILMGRLTKDPELRYSQGEKAIAVARWGIAVQRRYKQEGAPDADFINVVAFGKQAEFAEKYFRQGMKVCISGRIQTGSYVNRDGIKCYTTDVVVEEQDFCESKEANERYGASGQNSGAVGRPAPQDVGDGFMTIPDGIDEELPFV